MSGQPFRRGQGGRIDRGRPIRFRFDGRSFEGFAGDTLASALLANGVRLVGRSFKYHRPRGIFSAGAEEPNALVTLGDGALREPNLRATQVEIYDGLAAVSQNRWPSLGFDTGGLADRLSPLLPAGFYNKTFMWPAAAWPFYERLIRRMAGLGRAADLADPDLGPGYEQRHVWCDVLVVGAGAAGLAAALAAGRSGARVIVCDEQAEPGGGLLSCGNDAGPSIDGQTPAAWRDGALAELDSLAEVSVLPRTTAAAWHHGNYLVLAERVSDHLPASARGDGVPRQRLWLVRARQVILASGAHERPIVFADNDRPGVMLADAARTYANRYGVLAGRRAVVATGNDSAYGAALDLQAAGVTVAAVFDLRPAGGTPGPLARQAAAAGIEVRRGAAVVGSHGHKSLRAVKVRMVEGDGRPAGAEEAWPADLLAVSGGWTPVVHLWSQGRGTLRHDAACGAPVPARIAQAGRAVGAANGTFALAAALREAAVAGHAAAADSGFDGPPADAPAVDGDSQEPALFVPLIDRSRGEEGRKAFVDLQNDVTDKDLKLALREGYRAGEHVKRYTTTGMGTDQGKTANVNALAIVAAERGVDRHSLPPTTFRPPYTPVTFGALAGARVGGLFDTERTTPLHGCHVAAGARFEPVGQWQRAWYYPLAGEDMAAAVQREVLTTRRAAGLLDATTLGKIDLQGPDAAELLNRVYTNGWSKLAVGRARYGLMLGEDGMVMDDGVTTRLGEHHYHMTTTTGGAARVLAWLEEWLQTEWPELRVHLSSVTEQWAVMSLSGPQARAIVEPLCEGVDFDSFPHMSLAEGRVAGVPARLFRVSFTGEASYEINVPASWGRHVWEAVMTAGAPHGLTPYGTEAMHVLRAEKGFIIVGQETDGTVTPMDLGMDRLVNLKKGDFIGRRSLFRADTRRDDRKQLVGLMTRDPDLVLEEGVHMVATEKLPEPPVAMLGHVTSSYRSPNLGRSIALGLIAGGRARMGETVYAALPDGTHPVQIVEPVFVDPAGERLRG